MSAQWPHCTHFVTSTWARLSLTTMASAGHSRWHFMQPMQPTEHIFITTPPLSLLEHAGMIFWLSGMSLTMLLGQMSTQAPQPTHLERSTLAAEEHGRLAVLGTGVVEAHLGIAGAAGAGHEGHHLLRRVVGYAHDLGHLGSRGRAARHAAVAGGLAPRDRSRVAVTAGVAAAAAVGAGQGLTHRGLLGVDLHVEDLGGKGQQGAEQAAQHAQNKDG